MRQANAWRLFFLMMAALVVMPVLPANAEVLADPGRIEVVSKGLVGEEPGELALRYVAGEMGVPVGWRLWVELPTGWYNQNGCPRTDRVLKWQSEDAKGEGYFEARSLPEGVSVERELGRNTDVLGVGHRFMQLFSFRVKGRDLAAGESLELVFKQRLVNGRHVAPMVGGTGPVRFVVVSPDEELPDVNAIVAQLAAGSEGRNYQLAETWLEVKPGPATQLLVSLPSRARVGDEVVAQVRFLDANYNLADLLTKAINPTITSPAARFSEVPQYIGFDYNGFKIPITAVSAGVVRLEAEVAGLAPVVSNPMEIVDAAADQIYWGDVHSHSQWSHDGMGVHPVRYAREASALDFYAITEHVRSITEDEWALALKLTADKNLPGYFVTIPAMEDSRSQPSGHFNLYFNDANPPLAIPDDLGEIEGSFGHLSPIVIQHHSGIQWVTDAGIFNFAIPLFNKYMGSYVKWDQFKQVKRQALEIYSLHGASEFYDPADALSYEHSDLTLQTDKSKVSCNTGASLKGPHYARDAWAEGLVLGTIASSDDHRAQPGKRGGGLTAVMAPGLTREAVLKAIRQRRTYATTGDRVIVAFSINDQPMGSVIKPATDLSIKIHVVGTAPVKLLQVMRYDWNSKKWTAVIDARPGTDTVDLLQSMDAPTPAVYYLRLEQEGLVAGRPVRAWSSPIWVGEPPQ